MLALTVRACHLGAPLARWGDLLGVHTEGRGGVVSARGTPPENPRVPHMNPHQRPRRRRFYVPRAEPSAQGAELFVFAGH